MTKQYLFLAILVCLFFNVSAQTANFSPLKHNTLFKNANLSNAQGDYLFAGNTNQVTNVNTRRGLLQFDIVPAIPANATITAATLTMVMTKTGSGGQDISIHEVTNAWGTGTSNAPGNEGSGAPATNNDATWACSFGNGAGGCASSWTAAGGDFSAPALATTFVSGNASYNWSSANLVATVQNWLNTPASNFGLIILGNETIAHTAKRFTVNTITLSVTYTVPSVTSINTHPTNVAICDGENANFSITASNATSYQWQEFTTVWANLSNTGVYSGTNTAALAITGASPALTGNLYRCIAIGASNSDTSNTATLSVGTIPTVTLSPGDSTICTGDSITLTGSPGGTSQWYLNGLPIVGATSNSYVASTAGNYNMVKTNTSNCADSAITSIMVTVSVCSGVEEVQQLNNCTIYPNPIKNSLNVSTEKGTINQLELIDIQGRTVRQLNAINQTSIMWELPNIETGVYFLRVMVDGQLLTKKVVVQP